MLLLIARSACGLYMDIKVQAHRPRRSDPNPSSQSGECLHDKSWPLPLTQAPASCLGQSPWPSSSPDQTTPKVCSMPKRIPSQRILNAQGGPTFTQSFLAPPSWCHRRVVLKASRCVIAADPIIFKAPWTVISQLWCASKLRTEKLLSQVPKQLAIPCQLNCLSYTLGAQMQLTAP